MSQLNSIQPHTIDYSKGILHYRGGSYKVCRVSCWLKESPEIKKTTFVCGNTLERILYEDSQSKVKAVREAAEGVDKEVSFFVDDQVILLSPCDVVVDILRGVNSDWEFA